MKRMRLLPCALVLVLAAVAAVAAGAAPVTGSVSGCDASGCTIAPDAGPVAVDPAGFTLGVDISPEHLALSEPADDRGEWLLQLRFEVMGQPDGTEAFGDIVLTEMGGVQIAALNEQFDDQNSAGLPTLLVNYEIFGPDSGGEFFVHGLELGSSALAGTASDPITGLAWTSARLSVRQGALERGVWVAEPATGLLLVLGMLPLAGRRRLASAGVGRAS